MRTNLHIFLFLLIPNLFVAQNRQSYGRIIVKLKHSPVNIINETNRQVITGFDRLDAINEKYKASSMKKIFVEPEGVTYPEELQHVYVIEFNAAIADEELLKRYNEITEVEYAEPDFELKLEGQQGMATTPNDTYFASRQWSLKNTGNFTIYPKPSKVGADMNATLAWDITTGDTSTVVAIIDSGFKLDHPEVSGRIWINRKEIAGNGKDDDNNGFVDDYRGWNYVGSNNNPGDDNGHGTNVAGIIGCNANNSSGYAGVNWKCKLMIIKVLNSSGSGDNSKISDAILYAANNGAKVINLSLGSTSFSSAMQSAVTYAFNKGALVVAASGNNNVGTIDYPAAYTNAMAVGSTNPDDTRSAPFGNNSNGGSNYGTQLSVCAPGNFIYGLYHTSNTDFSYWYGGTSQATPHVSGLASLLLAKNPSLTPAQLKNIIEKTADDKVGLATEDVSGWDKYHGWGRINGYKALSSSLVGIASSNASNEQLSIIPNPANNFFKIIAPGINKGTNVNCRLYSISGALVYEKNFNAGEEMIIAVASLEAGLYLVKLNEGTDFSRHTKFVKQ